MRACLLLPAGLERASVAPTIDTVAETYFRSATIMTATTNPLEMFFLNRRNYYGFVVLFCSGHDVADGEIFSCPGVRVRIWYH